MLKKYVLELTAEELTTVSSRVRSHGKSDVVGKLDALEAQAKADREADDLRLPWRAVHYGGSVTIGGWTCVTGQVGGSQMGTAERAAKLMAAAPELLEAVQAFKDYMCDSLVDYDAPTRNEVLRLTARALRKVETGVPEVP